jgi:hypothetical protein
MSLDHHANGIADENAIDPGRVGDYRGGKVVRRDDGEPLTT